VTDEQTIYLKKNYYLNGEFFANKVYQ